MSRSNLKTCCFCRMCQYWGRKKTYAKKERIKRKTTRKLKEFKFNWEILKKHGTKV